MKNKKSRQNKWLPVFLAVLLVVTATVLFLLLVALCTAQSPSAALHNLFVNVPALAKKVQVALAELLVIAIAALIALFRHFL
jgi:uncharacterized membrane protein